MNESEQSLPPVPYDDEIDLRKLFRILWEGKWLVGGITFAGTLISVIVVLALPNVYRAEALLTPNDSEGAGALSALAAQYGGLASLAGINLPGGSSDKTALGLEILRSRRFIGDFVKRHDLLVPLMAAKGWDPRTDQLKIDSDIFDVSTKTWVRDVKPPKESTPSLLEAYEEFRDEVLDVRQDDQTGFVTLSVEYYSPAVAKQWADWLVKDLNATVMRQEVEEAEQAIEYLNQQIEATSLADLQTVFFRLIEEQTKTVMLANVSDEYLLKTIDPAVAPEEKAKPMRLLLVLIGAILSGFLALLLVLLVSGRVMGGKSGETV